MVIENIALGMALLGLTCGVAWAATRYYRSQIARLVHQLEEARAAAAHHALWSEEQRIELGRQVRALQSQVARLEAQSHNEHKRANRGSWSLPIVTPGTTAAAAGPQLRSLNMAATIPGITPNRPLVTIEGGRGHSGHGTESTGLRPADETPAELADDLHSPEAARREAEFAPRSGNNTTGNPAGKAPAGEERWRGEPQVATNIGYFSSRSGRLTIPTGGIATSTEFDFAATQPINVREVHGS
jgi:hypothetical protein